MTGRNSSEKSRKRKLKEILSGLFTAFVIVVGTGYLLEFVYEKTSLMHPAMTGMGSSASLLLHFVLVIGTLFCVHWSMSIIRGVFR